MSDMAENMSDASWACLDQAGLRVTLAGTPAMDCSQEVRVSGGGAARAEHTLHRMVLQLMPERRRTHPKPVDAAQRGIKIRR